MTETSTIWVKDGTEMSPRPVENGASTGEQKKKRGAVVLRLPEARPSCQSLTGVSGLCLSQLE